MSDVVRTVIDGAVAVVSLNRPDKLNAMSPEVFEGLLEAGRRCEGDDSIRAVLLRGEGRAFSSGLDLGAVGALGAEGGAARLDRTIEHLQDSFFVWARMRKPVVAAVHGYAFGGGLQLALAADIRFAATGCRLSAYEITYGIVTDLGATQRLPLLCGPARAKELIWTARRFSSEEAERWGIVNRVLPPDELEPQALEFARDLASRPPLPVAYAKELIDAAGRVPLEEGLAAERHAQLVCVPSNDCREAVAAAFENREATYTGT